MILLPSPQTVIKLFGIKGIEKKIFDIIKQNAPADKPLGISSKTFVNVLKDRHKPSPQTLESIFNSAPDLDNEFFRTAFENPVFEKKIRSLWEYVLPAFEHVQGFDLFPYSRQKLADLVSMENELLQKISAAKSTKERLIIYAENPFVIHLLSSDELSVLKKGEHTTLEANRVFGRSQIKALLYCAAMIDAEHAIAHKTTLGPKFSVLELLLPIFEPGQDKPVNPVERLFQQMKMVTEKSYTFMADALQVSTNNDNKTDSRMRKFRQWRQGEKQAPYDEIYRIMQRLYPESNEYILFSRTMFYYYAVFLSNLFKHSLYADDFFDNDRELAEWMTEHYNRYFNEAYTEMELLME